MEAILDLYAEPYHPTRPPLCFDEVPYQLVREIHHPLPLRAGQPARYDYEYKREGTCNLFMILQPLAGWRHVVITARRTKQGFARWMHAIVHEHFPHAEQISVVLDNLNTHTPAAFYETFPPPEARHWARKLTFTHTPKHSRWLNMAEVEISVLLQPCLDRRLATIPVITNEVAAWETDRNRQQATIDWRFTIATARDKLRRLYPCH